MQLTRENFLKFCDENQLIMKKEAPPFFNKNGNEIMRLLNKHFFETTVQHIFTEIAEVTTPDVSISWSKEHETEFFNKWIQDAYEITVKYYTEHLLRQHFLAKNNEKHVNFLNFLRFEKDASEKDTIEHSIFKRFYYWFIARHLRYYKKDVIENNKQLIAKSNQIIALNFDVIWTFDPDIVIEHFRDYPEVELVIEPLHGAYFKNTLRYYLMFDNGKIVDKITNKREKFDAVLHMLTSEIKTK